MKKLLAVILSLILCIVQVPLCAFAYDTTQTEAISNSVCITENLTCKQNLTLSFAKPENLNEITGIQFKLTLPKGFKVKSVISLLPSSWGIFYNTQNNRYIIYNTNLETLENTQVLVDGKYDLFQIELELDETITEGEYSAQVLVEDITTEKAHANLGSTTTYKYFTYSSHRFVGGSCEVCNELEKHTVTFQDKMGNQIYSTTVADGQKLTSADILNATNNVPNLYGYTPSIDKNGLQIWDFDTETPIYEDMVITAIYNKVQTKYAITVKQTNGKVLSYSLKFNDKLVITDTQATYWVLAEDENVVVATATEGESVYYVSGDANLVPKTDEVPAPCVSFVRKATEVGADGKFTFTVFAHASNIDAGKIVDSGVSFMSNTQYVALSKRLDVNQVLWKDQTFTSEESISSTAINHKISTRQSQDFMVSLYNVSGPAVRWAQAWVTYIDGSTEKTVFTQVPIYETFG